MQQRPQTQDETFEWPATKPWTRLHVDWAQINKRNILVIVDAGSRWIEAFNCTNKTAEMVIKCFRKVFASFGIPNTIVSDNRPELISDD